jgi:hypothetical protein
MMGAMPRDHHKEYPPGFQPFSGLAASAKQVP